MQQLKYERGYIYWFADKFVRNVYLQYKNGKHLVSQTGFESISNGGDDSNNYDKNNEAPYYFKWNYP